MDFTGCPECDAPAEVLARDDLETTSGPLRLIKLACINRHHFLMEERRA